MTATGRDTNARRMVLDDGFVCRWVLFLRLALRQALTNTALHVGPYMQPQAVAVRRRK